MTEELKNCPFCGDPSSVKVHGGVFAGNIGFKVECEGRCHAMTCYWHTELSAIKWWNTRPKDLAVFPDQWFLEPLKDMGLSNTDAKKITAAALRRCAHPKRPKERNDVLE